MPLEMLFFERPLSCAAKSANEVLSADSSQEGRQPGSSSAAQPVVTPGSSNAAQPVVTPGSSSAAQPVVTPGSSTAAQPVVTPGSSIAAQPVVKLECLKDVRRWMTTPEVVNSNLDIGLVKEAVTVLSRAPRPRQEEVQPLRSKWGIARNREGMPRLLLDGHSRARAESSECCSSIGKLTN